MAILLCSFSETVRERWDSLLAEEYVLFTAATSRELQQKMVEEDISLLLVHRTMVDAKMIADICRTKPLVKVFILSDRPSDEEGLALVKLGIVGYANTYISPARFTEAVRVVASGSVWIGQKVMQRLISETLGGENSESPDVPREKKIEGLTAREQEIAQLVSAGKSNLEIAVQLKITERTVKAHLSSVYAKTGTGNRLNLALLVKGGSK